MKKQKKAFSLIELSVVILVIGILVIGVSKSSKLMTESKIKSAQALTKSSPVALISGLSLWLESTMDESFDEDIAVDTALGSEGTITAWNNINPYITNSSQNAVQDGAASLNPRYVENGINGLPSVNFDRVNDHLILPTALSLGITNSDYEMFFVYQSNYRQQQAILTAASDAYNLDVNSGSRVRYAPINVGSSFTDVSHSGNLSAHIISLRVQNQAVFIKVDDGNESTRSNANMRSSETGNLTIGRRWDNGIPFSGEMGEIIIFNKNLTVAERRSIEEYLSVKWAIRL
jgi:prepilin-type N-terminal cleavage/methylation domain-containing protein